MAMPSRGRKPADLNRLAASILAEATAEPETCAKCDGTAVESVEDWRDGKLAGSVEIGCRTCKGTGRGVTGPLKGQAGGLKGGKARAAKLSPERRREIAEKAAKARWGRKRKP